MHRISRHIAKILVIATLVSGCAPFNLHDLDFDREEEICSVEPGYYEHLAADITYDADPVAREELYATPPPRSLANHADETTQYVDLSLQQVLEIGLQNSTVLRDLGGTVLRVPDLLSTIYQPGIQETDPRFGIEAALSEFDATFATDAFFANNDRALNNVFFGGGTRTLKQDFNRYQTEISKKAATGSLFQLRNMTEYDNNNAPGNVFPSAWTTIWEAEARQPLLRGGGLKYNRIAGASNEPFQFNGVLIARTNRDIELAEFEAGLRNYVSNLENAYWDLYFAYRDLDAKRRARDASLHTWRTIKAQLDRRGFEADKEAQARAQYFRFEREVQMTLAGQRLDATRTFNGSSGGTFRPTSGVYVAERRLRLLMGWPITDGQLIRPVTEPARAPIQFDWNLVLAEALQRRPEIRRQKEIIKRAEFVLTASKNFIKPRFDAVGRYRWRGFGDDLLDVNGSRKRRFDNAVDNLVSGDFQEWELGFELEIPIGFRQGHSAIRNSELRLAKERAILREQERQVVYDLSNAVADLEKAYELANVAYSQMVASRERVEVLEADTTNRIATPAQLLEAYSLLADAERAYFVALIEYMLALKNVHFEKGSLLDYEGIQLADVDGPQATYGHPPVDAQPLPDVWQPDWEQAPIPTPQPDDSTPPDTIQPIQFQSESTQAEPDSTQSTQTERPLTKPRQPRPDQPTPRPSAPANQLRSPEIPNPTDTRSLKPLKPLPPLNNPPPTVDAPEPSPTLKKKTPSASGPIFNPPGNSDSPPPGVVKFDD